MTVLPRMKMKFPILVSSRRAAHPQPILGVKGHAWNFAHAQPALLTLLRDPGQGMPNYARRVGFMAGPDPVVALVIFIRILRREVRSEENAGWRRISQKGLQSGFNLRFAGMGPYRPRQEIVELG